MQLDQDLNSQLTPGNSGHPLGQGRFLSISRASLGHSQTFISPPATLPFVTTIRIFTILMYKDKNHYIQIIQCQERFLIQKQDLTYLVILGISKCYLRITNY